MQCVEPALVQVLDAELANEALDVAVLDRVPQLDQDVGDAMNLRPSVQTNTHQRCTSAIYLHLVSNSAAANAAAILVGAEA